MAGFHRDETTNWVEFRKLPKVEEVDFHWSEFGQRHMDYEDAMAEVRRIALNAIREAQTRGRSYVIMTHGWSTSRNGKTTARSVIRALMRSKDATPYIVRNRCIQHRSCFVAAIRPAVQKGAGGKVV